MAEEEGAESAPKPKKPLGLIISSVLNLVSSLGVVGAVVYTQFLYHKPKITEEKERERIEKELEKQKEEENYESLFVHLDPTSVNIPPHPTQSLGNDGVITESGKYHFVKFALSLEVLHEEDKKWVEEAKPAIIDQAMQILGHEDYQFLNTTQGRYIVRTRIVEYINKKANRNAVVSANFRNFILQ